MSQILLIFTWYVKSSNVIIYIYNANIFKSN